MARETQESGLPSISDHVSQTATRLNPRSSRKLAFPPIFALNAGAGYGVIPSKSAAVIRHRYRAFVDLWGYHLSPFQFLANRTDELSGITSLRRLNASSIHPTTSFGDSLQL